jgi:hypothetical protein
MRISHRRLSDAQQITELIEVLQPRPLRQTSVWKLADLLSVIYKTGRPNRLKAKPAIVLMIKAGGGRYLPKVKNPHQGYIGKLK